MALAFALLIGGCSSDADRNSDVDATSPAADEPLVGRWSTEDSDGTCGTFSAATEPRVIEIAPGTDAAPYPTATEISGNPCLADGVVAFEPAGGNRVVAYGGPIGVPRANAATLLAVEDASFQLDVGGRTVGFQRIGQGPADDRSTLLGLPSPTDALTPRNSGLAGAITLLLLTCVSLPATLLTSTLDANLEALRRGWARITGRLESTTLVGRGFWGRWRGIATCLVLSASWYSLMQPGWGVNLATLTTWTGLLGALVVTTGLSLAISVRALRRRQIGYRPEVVFATAPLSILGVFGSRVAGFVPGFAYGLIVRVAPDAELDEADEARLVRTTSVAMLVLGIASWFGMDLARSTLGTSNPVGAALVAIAAGVFTVAVEALMVGLLPIRFLPGDTLRRWNRATWLTCWLGGAFLFVLVLLRPGLASAQAASIAWFLGFAVSFALGAVIIWRWFARRARTSF